LSQTRLTSTELKSWLEKQTGSLLAPVQAQAQRHREETRVALQGLADASKMLLDVSQKEIEKRNMKIYNRARALNKLASLFIERIKKLKPPELVSFDSFNAFANETQKTINVIDIDIRNWFPRISPFFIMDRRKFQPAYEKTRLTVNSLTDFINKEYVKSKTLEKTFQLIGDLQELEKQIAAIEMEKGNLQKERQLLEAELAELERQSTQLRGKEVLDQLACLEAETETLNTELKQMLNHLQKPFLKMQALATFGGGGGITPEELKMIWLYMENPFEAIVTEVQGCPTLRQILEKLSVMLVEDKLKLKPEKQRKAEQAVAEIRKSDALATLHNRGVEVANRKRQLAASAEMEEARRNLALTQQKTELLKTRKGNVEVDERLKENQRQELLERVSSIKKTIETNVQSFTGRQVEIQ
jgi:hypothetical protein